MASRSTKYSSQDLIQRLLWALIGYFSSLSGVVDLPMSMLAGLG